MNAKGSIAKLVRRTRPYKNQPALSTRLITATPSPARLQVPALDAAAATTMVPATAMTARTTCERLACSPRNATVTPMINTGWSEPMRVTSRRRVRPNAANAVEAPEKKNAPAPNRSTTQRVAEHSLRAERDAPSLTGV